MPRPAKPPMTLKEVKRAGKKETGAFKFTASQHARADRQDAQEEKRRKALGKERQREENKRKRDIKAERDRIVKQRMLDEGRITIEDTWGKVTSSQPRLNRFFVQRIQPPLKASRLSEQTAIDDSEDSHSSSHVGNVSEQPIKSQDSTTIEPHVLKKAVSGQAPRDEPSASLPAVTTTLMPRSPNRISNTGQSLASHCSQPSTLKERKKPKTSIPLSEHLHGGRSHQLRGEDCKENDAASLEEAKDIVGPHSRAHQEQCHLDNDYDTGEDFTDEIDDETLLILCSTQNSRDSPSQDGVNTKTEPVLFNKSRQMRRTDVDTERTSCQSIDNQHKVSGLAQPSESFSAIFNEIDDHDFLALADKVEASLVPSSNCNPGSAPNTEKTATPERQEQVDVRILKQVSGSHPQMDSSGATKGSIPRQRNTRPLPRHSERPLTTTMPPLTTTMPPPRKKKKGRILPWDLRADEFDTPGPSTQAVMLELVEQAEANIHTRRHKS
ncbi:hypothetical protein PV10_00072 [Exophiala mesophila]|uniref:Uncharacterized protein n=1 Tax=Exophiala mesophila TaxID=212818 RepID=A0A0D1ZNF9_EXOME|nr:uncharacterized protein PV10_00072 [Exophiala mesophila]KIV96172.1 hypothetical protein PV10_00072 [Exophiala mesophila]